MDHLSISFDPDPHTYIDSDDVSYTSVTTLTKTYFPPFDEHAAATRIAARTGRFEMNIISEWRQKRDAAARYGTRVHEHAESIIVGTPRPHVPENDLECRAFTIVEKAIAALDRQYEFLNAEQIIFDPLYEVAGTIDLPARNRVTGALAILDWKTCEDITNDAYGRSALAPITFIPDSKQAKYQIQLSVYAWLVTAVGETAYPSEGDPVEIALIHIPHFGTDPVWRPLVYDSRAAALLLEHHLKSISCTRLCRGKALSDKIR